MKPSRALSLSHEGYTYTLCAALPPTTTWRLLLLLLLSVAGESGSLARARGPSVSLRNSRREGELGGKAFFGVEGAMLREGRGEVYIYVRSVALNFTKGWWKCCCDF